MQNDPDSGMPVVSRPILPSEAPAAQPNDTVIIDPFDLDALARMPAVVPVSDVKRVPLAEPEHYAPVDREQWLGAQSEDDAVGDVPFGDDVFGDVPLAGEHSVGESLETEARHAAEPEPLPGEIEQDLPADFDEPEPIPAPVERAVDDAVPQAAARPDPFPWGVSSPVISDPDELEQTLIVPRRDNGERFVLQFSTGESVTVSGTGLLGRNPSPQPGEYFDQLVSISDPGKSVSKSHLEFGQDSGSFWVSDRYSGNGSVVREPGMAPKRLAPAKRYRVVRGTRIDIGEQFFVVS